jgi:hypothetical protein
MKTQPIAYLLNGSEHIYWILDLEDEVHSLRVIWASGIQECKGTFIFRWGSEFCLFVLWGLTRRAGSQALAIIHLP